MFTNEIITHKIIRRENAMREHELNLQYARVKSVYSFFFSRRDKRAWNFMNLERHAKVFFDNRLFFFTVSSYLSFQLSVNEIILLLIIASW